MTVDRCAILYPVVQESDYPGEKSSRKLARLNSDLNLIYKDLITNQQIMFLSIRLKNQLLNLFLLTNLVSNHINLILCTKRGKQYA